MRRDKGALPRSQDAGMVVQRHPQRPLLDPNKLMDHAPIGAVDILLPIAVVDGVEHAGQADLLGIYGTIMIGLQKHIGNILPV